MLSADQVPNTSPYSLVTGPHKSQGPTAEALKRALSRAGAPSLPWREFDNHYNQDLENAWDWYDQKHGAGTGNNGYGDGRWQRLRQMRTDPNGEHPNEWALDAYGQKLIQDEYEAAHPPPPDPPPKPPPTVPIDVFRRYMTEFVKKAIANEPAWHYNMSRPVVVNIDPSARNIQSDCSGFVIQAADYARRKANLMNVVQDPAKWKFSGFGNTDWYEDDWPKVWAPYRVGDLAHYANSRHVIVCYQPGDRNTALWGSHGREGGPESVRLSTYRVNDFMFVVRPFYIPLAV